jgi:hypothetical protein
MIRVVLDTTVRVLALLFEDSRLAWLQHNRQIVRITAVLAEPTARQLLRVLADLKFRRTAIDIEPLLSELLPWSETWPLPLPGVHTPLSRSESRSESSGEPGWFREHQRGSVDKRRLRPALPRRSAVVASHPRSRWLPGLAPALASIVRGLHSPASATPRAGSTTVNGFLPTGAGGQIVINEFAQGRCLKLAEIF